MLSSNFVILIHFGVYNIFINIVHLVVGRLAFSELDMFMYSPFFGHLPGVVRDISGAFAVVAEASSHNSLLIIA